MNKLRFAMIITILLMPYDENTLMILIIKILLLVETFDALNIAENYGSYKSEHCTVQLLKCCNTIDPMWV
jgi:hypothetical protein